MLFNANLRFAAIVGSMSLSVGRGEIERAAICRHCPLNGARVQGSSSLRDHRVLSLFCDINVSSASHILLMHTVPAGHDSEYRILSCTLCGQVSSAILWQMYALPRNHVVDERVLNF